MNINLGTFLIQCAFMGAWVFVVAGIFAVVEKVIEKRYPDFLRVDDKDAQEASPAPVAGTDVAKQA